MNRFVNFVLLIGGLPMIAMIFSACRTLDSLILTK